jgi:oligopeptidase A
LSRATCNRRSASCSIAAAPWSTRLSSDAVAATWADFAAPLGDGFEQLSRAWGIVGHVHSVNDVPAWRDAYNRMLPEVSRFYAEVGQNLKLFAKYKAIAAEQRVRHPVARAARVVEHEVRDFRLSGAELAAASKPRFQAISEELAQLSAKFSENLLDATNAFAELVTDASRTRRLPDDARQAAREAAERDGKQRLEVHPAHALLPAGDAVRRQPSPARCALPCLCHTRRRIRRRPNSTIRR